MGLDASSSVFVGFRVYPADFFSTKSEAACPRGHRGASRFCQECGGPVAVRTYYTLTEAGAALAGATGTAAVVGAEYASVDAAMEAVGAVPVPQILGCEGNETAFAIGVEVLRTCSHKSDGREPRSATAQHLVDVANASLATLARTGLQGRQVEVFAVTNLSY